LTDPYSNEKEGFGVLTTIDLKATMKQKLDIDFDKCVILGACNSPYARQALVAEEEVGLLLLCNVTVRGTEGKIMVDAFAPMTIAHLSGNERLREIAEEVEKKISKVVEALSCQAVTLD